MRQGPLIVSAVFQVYVIILANLHAWGGVRTDEAKYLLDIPYPHPPFLRGIISATEWLPFHDMLWRILFATALVHCAWLVWDMARDLSEEKRLTLTGAWLLSTGLILQAGTIMLAPATVIFVMVFLWLLSRSDLAYRYAGLVGLLWLCALFSAYQSILYAPIVWLVFRKAGVRWESTAFLLLMPIVLLMLYTLTNPLALATMAIHSAEGARAAETAAYAERIMGVLRLWVMAGGVMVGLVGTWGVLSSRSPQLIASFVLVLLYVSLSNPFPFYAILFTPLFIAGIHAFFVHVRKLETLPLLVTFLAGSAVVTFLFFPRGGPGPAKDVMDAVRAQEKTGTILISGSFGHDWQYHSRSPVVRYSPHRLDGAQAVICLASCEGMADRGWKRLPAQEVEAWVRE